MESQVREKIAYLKGLASGLEVDPESREGRLLHGLVDVLDSLSASVEHWADSQRELEEYVNLIDDDLGDVEEFLDLDADDEIEETSYIRLECPECGDTLYLDEGIVNDEGVAEVECPNCHHTMVLGDSQVSRQDGRSAVSSKPPQA
ncbi:CD1247 N-terminal domain-containing protein [Kyrpidia sp.]|uniref:CD1247 N-terminal domain-containing protein n=1 Tax=Kyrpidia sp. TaxID=2073077 RepID=UPI001811E1AF|nr:CD1247 N-terminal domain-containing protein [Kyrpidia sp.]MCL6576027.1 zinc-ribbon domain-containing protein [Kyrpidia sp.]HHY67689.1 AraC family transcriptional regulator [Alicyclobacillus sp.]